MSRSQRIGSSVIVAVLVLALGWMQYGSRTPHDVGGVRADAPRSSRAVKRDSVMPTSLADARTDGGATAPPHANDSKPGPRVRTVDGAGAPIAAAELWCRTDGDTSDWKSLGPSDERGFLELSFDERPQSILARANGYSSARIRLPAAFSGVEELHLERGSRWRGRIVYADGSAVPTHPRVLLYPTGQAPTKSEVAAALGSGATSRPRFQTRPASDLGEFEFDGLERGRSYSLLVAGGGVVLPVPRAEVVSGDLAGPIVVDRAYGCRVALRESGGRSLRTDERLWQSPGPQWFWDPEQATGVPTDSLAAVLAGIPVSETTRNASAALLFLFSKAGDAVDVGPIQFRGLLLGYAHREASIRVPRLEGELTTTFVELEPVATAWGRVRAHFEGAPARPELERDTRVQELGYLAFTSTDIDGFVQYKLTEVPRGDVVIDGFPCGLFSVGFFTHQGFLNFPPTGTSGSVLVSEGEQRIEFDLRSWRDLQVHALATDGSESEGEATVEVSRVLADGSSHSSFYTFVQSPYVIPGLIPDAYGVKLYKPFASGAFQDVDLRTEPNELGRAHIVFTP